MPADPKRRCNRCKAISLTAELADEGRTWVADVCAQCGARWFNDPPLAASDIPPADPLTPEAAAAARDGLCPVCRRKPVPVGGWVPEGCRAWLGPRADMDCYRIGYERLLAEGPAALLAAEARGREQAARWVRLGRWHDPDSCAEGILALAPAAPKAPR